MNTKFELILDNIKLINPDIICCVETKYKTVLDLHKFEDYESFHKMQIGKPAGGISIWAKPSTKPSRLDIDDIDDDISMNYLWILCQNKAMTAICAVYLRNQSDPDAREINTTICQRLMQHINWCRLHNYKVFIIGDFNGHIGNDEWGVEDNHETINNNGFITRNFIRDSDLKLINSDVSTEGKWTWGYNKNNTNPQILDIALRSPDILNIKTIIDEKNTIYGNIGNKDHCFIHSKISVKAKENIKQTKVSKDKWKINDETNWHEYQEDIRTNINNMDNNEELTENSIFKLIENAGIKTIGYRENSNKKRKESKRIRQLNLEISNYRKELRKNPEFKGNLLNELFKKIRERRQIRQRAEMARIEKAHNKWINNPKRKFHQLYDTMKTLKRGVREKVTLIDDDKIPIIGEENTKSHITEFWESIFTMGIWPEANPELKRLGMSDIINGPDKLDLENEITVKEIKDAIHKLKNNTSAGTTNIPPEFIKQWPEEMTHLCHALFNKWFDSSYFPEIGKTQEVTLLHKKGSKSKIKNYRTLCLGCNLCKLYLLILTGRLEKITEKKNILGYIQHGFRANKRIEDCILVIQHTVQRANKLRRSESPTLALLDICKAYDRVWRKGLWKKLKEYGFPDKLINAIKSSYQDPGATITFQDIKTNRLNMPVGLRQGCTMSPILWALFIADLGKEIEKCHLGIEIGTTENKQNISGLFFADDMLLFAKNENNMEKLLRIVGDYANKWKIEFSGPKSLIIPLKRPIEKEKNWALGYKYIAEGIKKEIYIQEEKEAKYLGITLCQNSMDIMKKHKLDLAERTRKETYRCYKPATVTSRPILYGTKIWKTYVIPKILHGIAAIPFSIETFRCIETQQREYIRTIARLPRGCNNMVLYGETGLIPMKMEAEKRTINYLAHIQKLNTDNIVKTVLLEQSEIYNNKNTSQIWLTHAIKCCNKYNIDYKNIPKKDIIKEIIQHSWILEYNTNLNESESLSTYYAEKTKPKINYKLNLQTGGDFWLKARSGCLILNYKTNQSCSRCDENALETTNHLLWECPNNIFLDNYEQHIQQLWKLLPSNINGHNKPEYNTCNDNERNGYLILSTNFIFNDMVNGQIINIVGTMIKESYKIRPESLQYSIMKNKN